MAGSSVPPTLDGARLPVGTSVGYKADATLRAVYVMGARAAAPPPDQIVCTFPDDSESFELDDDAAFDFNGSTVIVGTETGAVPDQRVRAELPEFEAIDDQEEVYPDYNSTGPPPGDDTGGTTSVFPDSEEPDDEDFGFVDFQRPPDVVAAVDLIVCVYPDAVEEDDEDFSFVDFQRPPDDTGMGLLYQDQADEPEDEDFGVADFQIGVETGTGAIAGIPGAWTWSGVTATTSQVIGASAGGWVWSGGTATTSQVINATSGAWTWAGLTATTSQVINADGAPNGWVWSGATATLSVPSGAIDATPGAWTWAGSTATTSQVINADGAPNGWVWSGGTATTSQAINADGAPGGWVWAGGTATTSQVINADGAPGGWVWSGTTQGATDAAGNPLVYTTGGVIEWVTWYRRRARR